VEGVMKSPTSLRGLLWYPATLAIWLVISCAALVSSDVNTAIPGIVSLAVISALSLLFESTYLVYLVCGIALAIFGIFITSFYGIHNTSWYDMITFTAAAIGTAIISWHTRRQIAVSSKQVERDRLLIEELRINDSRTGLMRFHYARRTLTNEISRSLRYGKTLTLMVLQIDNWEDLANEIGMEARENLLVAVSELLFSNFRNVDTLFINIDKIGVILPETDEECAKLVAKRINEQIHKKTKAKLFIGIVCFPIDSVSEEDLFRKGDLALKAAIQSGQEIFPYSQIHQVVDENSEEDLIKEPDKNIPDIKLTPIVVNIGKMVPDDEVGINFLGIKNLTDIEPIQHALSKISEIEYVRILDYHENILKFSVKTAAEDIPSLLKAHLGIPIGKISKVEDEYQVLLDKKSKKE
jgi:diguanylate cyclase (GGDEF)-like protein